MNTFKYFVLRLAIVVVVAASSHSLGAQAVASSSQTDSITVSVAIDKDHLPPGQSPWVLLTFNNRADRDLYLHGDWFQLHIEGEGGEPPTKLRQRMAMHKLLPSEAPLRDDENAEKVISVGKSRIEKIDVSYYYDLSLPGKYSVYVDVKDPLSGK